MDKDPGRSKCGKVRRALLHLLLIVGGATGLKDLTINVPPIVRSADTVTLSCNYDLEGSSLYSIQWLFEDTEFYSYLPDRRPSPSSTFVVDGIHVNTTKSNMQDVTLVNVSRKLTGNYKCEVSAGSPSYHTLIRTARMEVVDAPKTDPTIDTEKERVAGGETLRLNCTSGSSRPASIISWKLNGDSVVDESPYRRVRSYTTPQENDTKMTRSTIEFKVTNDMFRNGRLHLRCTASIFDIYRKSTDIEILEDEPLPASITGDASPHSHTANRGCGLHWPWNGLHSGALTLTALTTTVLLMTAALTMTSMTAKLPVSGSR